MLRIRFSRELCASGCHWQYLNYHGFKPRLHPTHEKIMSLFKNDYILHSIILDTYREKVNCINHLPIRNFLRFVSKTTSTTSSTARNNGFESPKIRFVCTTCLHFLQDDLCWKFLQKNGRISFKSKVKYKYC